LSNRIWKPKTSVKLRFALIQGGFIAVVILLLAATLYFPVQKHLVSITDSSYKNLANNLAAGIYPSYISNDRQRVINAIQKVEGQQGVKYVLIIDSNNNVYYDSTSGKNSYENKQLIDSLTPKDAQGDLLVGKLERDGEMYYNYVAPFIFNNQLAYTIRLGIDGDLIDGEFQRLSKLFIYMGSFGIIIGILASYLLAAKLTKPIVLLTESALAIRAGNLNAYADISTNDELEQLSREFQSMVEKLKQFYFQEYSQKKEALDAKQRLEEINSRLKELNHQKTDFLNAASHQLRTPLSIIHWSLSLIVEEAPHMNIPKDQLELLQESLKSTKRMVDLVNDLLDLSRIEQGRKEMTWGINNFGSICQQLVTALQVLAQNKKLQLTYQQIGEIPDSFLDEKAFYQVLNNFVDNAIKYTAEGYVKVTARANNDHVEIAIQDSGIGMTEEEKKRLFTRFSRGSEASKMFANGSGLGMFVAQSILKQHGGDIHVESEHGSGTCFTLYVPIYMQDPSKIVVAQPAQSQPTTPALVVPAITLTPSTEVSHG